MEVTDVTMRMNLRPLVGKWAFLTPEPSLQPSFFVFTCTYAEAAVPCHWSHDSSESLFSF